LRDASPVDHLDLAGEMARWSGVRTADELVLRRPGAGSFRGDDLTENEAERTNRTTRSAAVATGVACFLAELGDKTMLATITLANTE
jgi:hypothetical protein